MEIPNCLIIPASLYRCHPEQHDLVGEKEKYSIVHVKKTCIPTSSIGWPPIFGDGNAVPCGKASFLPGRTSKRTSLQALSWVQHYSISSDAPVSRPSYADDFTLSRSGVDIADLVRELQRDIDAVEAWAAAKMLSISPSKSTVTLQGTT